MESGGNLSVLQVHQLVPDQLGVVKGEATHQYDIWKLTLLLEEITEGDIVYSLIDHKVHFRKLLLKIWSDTLEGCIVIAIDRNCDRLRFCLLDFRRPFCWEESTGKENKSTENTRERPIHLSSMATMPIIPAAEINLQVKTSPCGD